jgi:hypothetical protein
MNKVLVKLYVPIIDGQYDIWLPLNKKIYNIIVLLSKAVNELEEGYYQPEEMPILYNRLTGMPYDINLKVQEADIRNGTEIVLI